MKSLPQYRPYYWTSLLLPPFIISVGVIFATTYGVSFGIRHGIDSSLKSLETTTYIEGIVKQALKGASRFVQEADLVEMITNKVMKEIADIGFSSIKK
jgi:hypothetical protein